MMEDPETVLRLQQNLLDLICERFPAPSCLHNDPMTCHCNERVILSCAKHSGGHVVTPPVFLLLEIIEAAFGTNYLKIEAISVKLVRDLELSALVARVLRQKKKVTLFSAQIIELESNKSAEAFHTLVTASHSCVQYPPQGQVEGMLLWVDSSEEDFGGEGWETLAKTLQLHTPGMTKVVWTTEIMTKFMGIYNIHEKIIETFSICYIHGQNKELIETQYTLKSSHYEFKRTISPGGVR